MRIALCCKVYPTSRPGGMGFVCQDRARALVKLGHDVHVLTTGRKTHAGELINDEGVEVHHMPCKSAYYSDEFAAHSEHHCRGFKPDILHTDSFDVNRPWQVAYGEARPVITAATMHGFCWGAYLTDLNLWMRHGGTEPAFDHEAAEREKKIMLGFDRMIGISRHEHWLMHSNEFVRNGSQGAHLLGISSAKLVYNPLPDYFFDNVSSKLPETPRRFLCAAVSGYHQRGFLIAEQACKQAGVELVIAQDIPRENMPALIDSCHALLLPTAYGQGLDLSVGEAIVRRRPVFATATGSCQKEAHSGGIYEGAIRLFPLSGMGLAPLLVRIGSLGVDWQTCRSEWHRSATHATNWLEAILG